MPLIILALGIIALFVLIVGVRLNSYLSLVLVCLGVGIAEGMPIMKVVGSIENGVGGTLGHLALVISFGAMLGKLMADSGGAQRIAMTLIEKFGRKHIKWALCLTGFIVGIVLFYEVGFVLLIPLVFTVAAAAQVSLLEVGLPMVAALSVTHGFLPPHPGPTALSVLLHADIGLTLIYGIIIAVPTVLVAGPWFYNTIKDLKPKMPEGLYSSKQFSDEEMPGFAISVFTALVPVFLMAAASITKLTMPKDDPLAVFFDFVGNADMALLIAVFIGIFTFGLNRGKSMKEVMDVIQESVLAIAMILLVVGGGGAFKQILIDSGVSQYIVHLMEGVNMSPLLLGWLIASILRIAVGSATVAGLTAGGIMAPVVAATGTSPELMVLACGAGSLNAGPPNDPGFWMFKEFFNLSVKETLRSWSIMETIIACMGLIGVLIIDMFIH
ncbi:High-affinity gluconate transporter [Propionispora sp. 2/2-37]|uniref:gluconate:H+ symporter n=1 Tax=Propionispora sp. 2/2-37 TaxID=1677858 RepID=UPI0006BB8759|nr:gluconate:H+ symporter [Propionispora sp. 2/2-37]CUH97538.1 High-affinity gluconate transporter [Propionispora sp. 2/2-37]